MQSSSMASIQLVEWWLNGEWYWDILNQLDPRWNYLKWLNHIESLSKRSAVAILNSLNPIELLSKNHSLYCKTAEYGPHQVAGGKRLGHLFVSRRYVCPAWSTVEAILIGWFRKAMADSTSVEARWKRSNILFGDWSVMICWDWSKVFWHCLIDI